VIGWLYDLVAARSEKKGMADVRRRLIASLEATWSRSVPARGSTLGVVRAELPGEPSLYRAGILGRATRISS
jgi:hypothetical protein